MDQFLDADWLTAENAIAFAQFIAACALLYVTYELRRETTRLADMGSKPEVTVSFEVNRIANLHLDVVVENSGNAPAYDIKISVSPPPPKDSSGFKTEFPFHNLTLIRPGQILRGVYSDYESIKGKVFDIEISWTRQPKARKRERVSYSFDPSFMERIVRIVGEDPDKEMAKHLSDIAKSLNDTMRGFNRMNVNTYTHEDRERSNREQREMIEKRKQARSQGGNEGARSD